MTTNKQDKQVTISDKAKTKAALIEELQAARGIMSEQKEKMNSMTTAHQELKRKYEDTSNQLAEADAMLAARQHQEASFVTWLDVFHPSGQQFNVTMRQGQTTADVIDMLNLHNFLVHELEQRGYRGPWSKKANAKANNGTARQTTPAQLPPQPAPHPPQPAPPPQQPAPAPSTGNIPDRGMYKIVRLLVVGTSEKPDVSMFSNNPNLKYRVLHAPAHMLIKWLLQSYPSSFDEQALSPLTIVNGKPIEVDWNVEWVKSQKDERFKDIVSIEIPKLGPPQSVGGPDSGPAQEQSPQAVEYAF